MSEDKKSPLDIILTIISIVAAIAFLSKILKRGEEEEQEERAKKSRQKGYTTIPQSYPDFMYKDFADILDKALMKDSTEDEETVYNVFKKMKNISDVNKTIEAFGTKRQMFSTYYLTLPQAMQYLSKGEKKKLNDILAGKKIDYSFE